MTHDGRVGGTGAHGPFHDSGRCPVCRVPLRAPHLNSCDHTGLWLGPSAAGRLAEVRDRVDVAPYDDDDEDDDD